MLIFGHGLPSGIVSGRRVDSSVHGQPVFSAGALGSSANDGHCMIEPFYSSPVPASIIGFGAGDAEPCSLTGAPHAHFSPASSAQGCSSPIPPSPIFFSGAAARAFARRCVLHAAFTHTKLRIAKVSTYFEKLTIGTCLSE